MGLAEKLAITINENCDLTEKNKNLRETEYFWIEENRKLAKENAKLIEDKIELAKENRCLREENDSLRINNNFYRGYQSPVNLSNAGEGSQSTQHGDRAYTKVDIS